LLSTFGGAFPARVIPSGDDNWAVIGSVIFDKNDGLFDEGLEWVYVDGGTTGTVVF